MSERRIDQVRIQLSAGGPAVISWDSRQALLAGMRLPSMQPTRKAFQDAGPSILRNALRVDVMTGA